MTRKLPENGNTHTKTFAEEVAKVRGRETPSVGCFLNLETVLICSCQELYGIRWIEKPFEAGEDVRDDERI
jgi:hypothetical protein